MARPRVHDDRVRAALLDHAGRTVTENGVAALSLRNLAAEAGTSTTAVYSLFGGKSELLAALFQESFAGFGAAQRAAPRSGHAVADLTALGAAYWTWAREHPHLYGVMFSPVAAGVERTAEQLAAAASTMEPLTEVVSAGVRSGELEGDPQVITFAVWAAVHGVVSLALAGCVPGDAAVTQQVFTATAAATVRGWLAPT